LKKDKFKFGDFGEIQASEINQKTTEMLIEQQLDNLGNFDHLVKDDPLQLQQSYEVTIGQLVVNIEGFTHFDLKSRSVRADTADKILLSAQVPHQYNREGNQKAGVAENFRFSLEAKKFYFGFFYYEFNSDLKVRLQYLRVTDEIPLSQSNRNIAKRDVPLPLKRYQVIFNADAGDTDKDLLDLALRLQEFKSPRYKNIEMDMDIQLARIQINWNPIVMNRIVRFCRFIKYPKDILEAEQLIIQQTLKVRF